MARDGRWRALVYRVRGTVTRPAEGGGTETLPERLGVRAACHLPDTERGLEEARGRVEAILGARGIPGFGLRDADSGPASADAGFGWAARALAALGRLAARPLAAAQRKCYYWPPLLFGVGCPELPPVSNVGNETVVTITCPAGFDFAYSSVQCVRTGFSPVPPVVTPGPPPTGGSGPGNTNNNTNNNTNTGPRTVDFTLTCSSPTRGKSGSCSVSAPDSAGVRLGSLNYSWSSTIGNATIATAPNGESSWSGTATENVNVEVAITDPRNGVAGATVTAAVSVIARNWELPQSDARPTYEDLGPDWGLFTANLPRVEADSGTGPWSGRPYVGAEGDFGTMLRFVPDLSPDSTRRPYHGTRKRSDSLVLAAACPNAATVPDSMRMDEMNDHCGKPSAYDAWVAAVEAHEREHESKYNGCAESTKFANTITEVEGALANKVGKAVEDWKEFVKDLQTGTDYGVGKREATVWNHHPGHWHTEALTLGHSGTECPS